VTASACSTSWNRSNASRPKPPRGRAAFPDDEVAQSAVIRWVEIIGEAARGLTEELRQAHPEVPWRQMVAMRNVLIHGYFDIDVDLVWSVAENDLPKLAAQIRAIVEEMA
jgi:uncharacterized protein with HEPN domain